MPGRGGDRRVEVADARRLRLGEGTVWDAEANELGWVDILAGRGFRREPRSGTEVEFEVEGELSAALPRREGGSILAVGRELLAVGSEDRERRLASVEPELVDNRFNDCRCDPQGRVWAGTMSKNRVTGTAALYRLGRGLAVERVLTGTTISNGIGWSCDGDRMYFIDSTTQRVQVFDFDGSDGSLHEGRCLVEIEEADGLPDGLAVDSEDNVWVALFGGGAVRCYDPAGRLLEVIELPTSNPTCPAFGDEDLGTLYVTTARHRLSEAQLAAEPLAGALFCVRPGVAGLPSRRADL